LCGTLAKEIIRNIYNDSKRIDILVNNADYGLLGALEDLPTGKIKDKFETKFYRTIRVTQSVYL